MLFSSTTFIYLFLPAVILVYFVILKNNRRMQNIFLFFASLVFYSWDTPKHVFILIASIVINWLFGLCIDRFRDRKILAKSLLTADILFNTGLLFVFKYLNFTGSLLQKAAGVDLQIPDIALPLGISFFTFQAMSYVIDVYRQKGEVQTSLLDVGLYISFFPQLIAGPIVRYETIADQIKNRKETLDDFFDGFARFVMGFSKKVLLANHISYVADTAFNTVQEGGRISVLFAWLGMLCYALQIYFDFSGYSDMAIGMGRMFGFHFLENFNYPFISASLSECWNRWHISLGTWFRDYVYIPLGGNRCSKGRNLLNIFIVWTLTGLWHGANLTFLVWGWFNFIILMIEKSSGIIKKKGRVIHFFTRFYTIFILLLEAILFRSTSLTHAFNYFKTAFGWNAIAFSDGQFTGWLSQNLIVLTVCILLSTPVFPWLSERFRENGIAKIIGVTALCMLFALSAFSLVSNSYNPFIYFNF